MIDSEIAGQAASEKSRALRHAARLVRWIVGLGVFTALFAVAVNIYAWSTPQRVERLIVRQMDIGGHLTSIDASVQIAGFLLTLLPVAVGLYALLQIYRLSQAISQAGVDWEQLTGALHRIALALICMVPCDLLTRAGYSIILTYHNPPGQRMLSVSVSSDMLLNLAVALLVLAVAFVLRAVSHIIAEHQQFV